MFKIIHYLIVYSRNIDKKKKEKKKDVRCYQLFVTWFIGVLGFFEPSLSQRMMLLEEYRQKKKKKKIIIKNP
jgi:hypothetical protein